MYCFLYKKYSYSIEHVLDEKFIGLEVLLTHIWSQEIHSRGRGIDEKKRRMDGGCGLSEFSIVVPNAIGSRIIILRRSSLWVRDWNVPAGLAGIKL